MLQKHADNDNNSMFGRCNVYMFILAVHISMLSN